MHPTTEEVSFDKVYPTMRVVEKKPTYFTPSRTFKLILLGKNSRGYFYDCGPWGAQTGIHLFTCKEVNNHHEHFEIIIDLSDKKNSCASF